MDDRGTGSCLVLYSVPSGFSFLVPPSAKPLVAGHGKAGKGRSRVLIPDLVVNGESIVVLIESYKGRIIVNVSSRQAYLLGWVIQLTFIGLMGSSAVLANKVALLPRWKKRSWRGAEAELGELVEIPVVELRYVVALLIVGGILSSHSAIFPVREKWKNLNLDVSLVAPSARMLSTILK
ncbi:hypothetical protein Tco_1031576 [Tanacetum coccineum]|uniref:Magnesium transporter n=1 Tax=Tanacetum coccineum TaxID=301880 RepID=A0ABQ5G9C7_9ASTR